MARLLLGPLLRPGGVWVELDRPCEVAALGASARSFTVAGHHYALVPTAVERPTPLEVRLDGEVAWSAGEGSVARPPASPGGGLDVLFGSCRPALPERPPYTRTRDEHPRGRGVDAFAAAARTARDTGRVPDLLILLGDQIYGDDLPPDLVATLRPPTGAPAGEAFDFPSYAEVYRRTWSPPAVRWLLSCVPSLMLFDDHDVDDGWNASASWLRARRATAWWPERIVGALMAYWVYQHLGNLSAAEREADPAWQVARDGADATEPLRALVWRADRTAERERFSYAHDVGGVRVVGIDARSSRLVADDGARRMLDEREWAWVDGHLTGDVDHLLVATSLPVFLGRGMQAVEGGAERVAAGAWGRAAARLADRVRRAFGFEHWPAFDHSFRALVAALRQVAEGRRGRAPASIMVLAGDVHHGYLTEIDLPGRVWQVVASPFRNQLSRRLRRAIRVSFSPAFGVAGRAGARAAGLRPPPVRWWRRGPIVFDNHVGRLRLAGRTARVRLEAVGPDGTLRTALERELA